jgi:hypothetical protein
MSSYKAKKSKVVLTTFFKKGVDVEKRRKLLKEIAKQCSTSRCEIFISVFFIYFSLAAAGKVGGMGDTGDSESRARHTLS